MSVNDFPFLSLGPGCIPKPILPIIVKNPHNNTHLETLGLIDTGADSTIIPKHMAEFLGHNTEKGLMHECQTGGGAASYYEHTFTIDIVAIDQKAMVDYDNVVMTISEKCFGVLPELKIVLLGVNDFLSQYVLTINYPKEIFSLRQSPTL